MFNWLNKPSEENNNNAIVHIYKSEYEFIKREALKHPNIETGGDLFGTFTHGEMPVIWLALGPGLNADHQLAEFSQDTRYTSECQQFLMQNYGVQYIGTWHSHHKLGLQQPSSGDVRAAQTYARRHDRDKTLEIIITFQRAEIYILPYFYPDAKNSIWVKTQFRMIDLESPIRGQLHFRNMNGKEVLDANLITSQPALAPIRSRHSFSNQFAHYENAVLEREFRNLDGSQINADLVNIDKKTDQDYLISIELNEDILLAIAVNAANSDKLNLLQINLIDTAKKTIKNVLNEYPPKELERAAERHELINYLYSHFLS